jgi:hypothetical protein
MAKVVLCCVAPLWLTLAVNAASLMAKHPSPEHEPARHASAAAILIAVVASLLMAVSCSALGFGKGGKSRGACHAGASPTEGVTDPSPNIRRAQRVERRAEHADESDVTVTGALSKEGDVLGVASTESSPTNATTTTRID